MDDALDVSYQVVDGLFGPGSGVPWWAWIAPLVLVFGKLLMPSAEPATTAAAPAGKKSKKAKKKK
ncbi:hypothetical protein [Actinoplanes sp. DH11]|uniref:hypothetical protein n=1 Tax=Actinoplanes sp. DH11 TaxID=2857011 RepID=UPI001E4AAD00|nr:hypothetical protein [Actinoplanes sp. DH11]